MPLILQFILRRILVFVYSILVFLGVAPEAEIQIVEDPVRVVEERQDRIADLLKENTDKVAERVDDVVTDVKDSIDQIEDRIDRTQIVTPQPPKPVEIDVTPEPLEPAVIAVPVVTEISQPEINNEIQNVLLNMVCVRRNGNLINVSTGSAVLISPKGVVLTNAHVAQFMLLEDHLGGAFMDCSLYRENIPTFGYKADIVYLPPEWIRENHDLINAANPTGTGEDDYAVLYITGNTNPALSLPSSFPYAIFSTDEDEIYVGRDVIAAGYPGAPKNLLDITSSRSLKTDLLEIIDVFTLSGQSVDIFSTSRSHVGAKGSSGGGIFSQNNKLIGLISTTNGANGNAQINALTLSYVNDDLRNESGKTLQSMINGNLSSQAGSYKNRYQEELSELLLGEL